MVEAKNVTLKAEFNRAVLVEVNWGKLEFTIALESITPQEAQALAQLIREHIDCKVTLESIKDGGITRNGSAWINDSGFTLTLKENGNENLGN